MIKTLCKPDNLPVCLSRSSHNHLCCLACGSEGFSLACQYRNILQLLTCCRQFTSMQTQIRNTVLRCVQILSPEHGARTCQRVSLNQRIGNLSHGREYIFGFLLGSQKLQRFLGGKLYIDAEPVRKQPYAMHKMLVCAGYDFGVDISCKAPVITQYLQTFYQFFAGMVRGSLNRRGNEQPLYIIAFVKLYGKIRKLRRLKGSPRRIGRPPADAVFTVVHTGI